jgi:antitoxin component YwqK of YwqJK toxin-antitoxin module
MSEARVTMDDVTWDTDGCALHEGTGFTGELLDVADDGFVISSYGYRFGFPHGPYREWFAGGQVAKEGTMRDGLAIGLHREWHPNGRLASEIEFDDHGRELARRRWDEHGDPA